MHDRVCDDVALEIADDLMHFHIDATILEWLDGDGIDTRIDLLPLIFPVGSHGVMALHEAALESPRPLDAGWPGAAMLSKAVSAPSVSALPSLNVSLPPTGFRTDVPSPGPRMTPRIR